MGQNEAASGNPSSAYGLFTSAKYFSNPNLRRIIKKLTGVDPGSAPIVNLNDIANKFGVQPVALFNGTSDPIYVTAKMLAPGGNPDNTQTPFNVVTSFASGAGGTSIQLKTLGAGKGAGYITAMVILATANSKWTYRDETSDATSTAIGTGFTSANDDGIKGIGIIPIKYVNGIRFEAADQAVNTTYTIQIIGWEE